MTNQTEVTRLGRITARIVYGYYGDKTGFIKVSNHYGLCLNKLDNKAEFDSYKAAPVSMERLTKYIKLADKHPASVKFRSALDDYIKDAIDNLY
eukprot:9424762-Ditylum_brightwellii.AAC.1